MFLVSFNIEHKKTEKLEEKNEKYIWNEWNTNYYDVVVREEFLQWRRFTINVSDEILINTMFKSIVLLKFEVGLGLGVERILEKLGPTRHFFFFFYCQTWLGLACTRL